MMTQVDKYFSLKSSGILSDTIWRDDQMQIWPNLKYI